MAVLKMNFLSQALGMQTNVTICLPSFSFADIMSGRENVYVPGMKYQVLWLLHGGSGDDSDYVNFSNIVRYADENKIAVVMPCDYNMSYTDHPDGGKYLSFVVDELPKLCRAFFPFSEKREDNFVGGLSMGAGGAIKAAMLRPEQYAAALIMSGGGIPAEDDTTGVEFRKNMRGKGMPMPYIPDNAEVFNLKDTAEAHAANKTEVPKLYMTWGDKDALVVGSCRNGSKVLKEMGFDVYAEEVPGYGHEWDFWDLTLKKAIKDWLPTRKSAIYPE